jgi:hypothetical protein
VYVHDDSSIELAGFRAPVRRTHGEREALHELLAQNGCVLPTEIPADGPGWQRHLNELLCQPRPARDIVEQWLLGGCGAESQAEDPVRIRKNNRPLLMIGGRATAKEEARLVCAVVLLRPWCQPAGATHVIWSSSDGWTYPAAANDASNIAEAARLCWRGREYNLRLARCYQEAWRKPKPPKRTAIILQPGCVLLRNAFSAHEQQSLVDTCIRVGEHAKAGFFTPTYEANGAMGSHSMRLQMVCLGRHWDHCNGSYSPRRTNIDDEPVLPVPDELSAAAAKVARWASLAGDAPSAATGGRCAGTRAISGNGSGCGGLFEVVSVRLGRPVEVQCGIENPPPLLAKRRPTKRPPNPADCFGRNVRNVRNVFGAVCFAHTGVSGTSVSVRHEFCVAVRVDLLKALSHYVKCIAKSFNISVR